MSSPTRLFNRGSREVLVIPRVSDTNSRFRREGGRLMHVRRLTLASCASLCIAIAVMLVFVCAALASPPDNRQYELVSPVEKGGNSFIPDLVVADTSGEHVVIDGGVANALLSSGASWMSETRSSTGWSGVQVGPPPGPEATYQEQRTTALGAVSEDFSRFAFQTNMSLDPRDQGMDEDLYVREGATGPLTWASGPPAPAVKTTGPILENYADNNSGCLNPDSCVGNTTILGGASADLSDLVWSQRTPVVAPPASLPGSLPDTHTYGYEVYESVSGVDQLVGLVPAEGSECDSSQGGCVVPPCGAAMGNAFYESNEAYHGFSSGFAPTKGAVSGDGSQVVFTSPDPQTQLVGCAPPRLYVRQGGVSTVEVSASQKTNGGGPGGVDSHGPRAKLYVGSTEAGGRITGVFFTSSEELTNDANTGSEDQGNDLYEYDLQSGKLSDLTVDQNSQDPNGAGVINFIGAATDGSIVYFTASGVLAAGASAGQSNLYVYEAASGRTTFIASGNGVTGAHVGTGETIGEVGITSNVTPDGRQLVFTSSERLTGYDQMGYAEVYLYDASGNRLVCVSCNPSGAAPAGSATLPRTSSEGAYDGAEEPQTLPEPRVVSDDGSRVFFSSPDQLTVEAPQPAVTRAPEVLARPGVLEPNVYEYENGRVYLVAADAALLTSTPSGNDVFFNSVTQLVSQDRDGSVDVYNARVDGGFPALAPAACSGTSCQGVPASSPIFATPPSVTFEGVGNFPASSPAPAVKAKTTAKKTKKKKAKKKKTKKKVKKKAKSAKGSGKRSDRGGQ
jgi:hypothetical protein